MKRDSEIKGRTAGTENPFGLDDGNRLDKFQPNGRRKAVNSSRWIVELRRWVD